MKERIIRISVLSVVFILALIGFSAYINRGNANMTADMGSATLPTISFQADEREINLLAGHVNDMEPSAVRDTITPLDDKGVLKVNIQPYEQKITKITCQVYTLDGKEKLYEKTEKDVGQEVEIQMGEHLEKNQEVFVKIKLSLDGDKEIYYYTRVIPADNLYFSECAAYVNSLHANMLTNTNTDDIKKVMESNEKGDNTTLQHVNIYSDLEHATWGSLKPEVLGDIIWNVQETKEAYTSIQLRYRVKCAGDNNDEEIYLVKEFFRVRYAGGKLYLLTYDRTLEEVFDGSKVVLTGKGINLGLAAQDMQYKANQEGTIVAFVQANELWSYNKEEDEFALVFSFADSEKEDVRNRFDKHSLKILSMEENGNVTFAVYGYMNRGTHEGKSGAAIYYFNLGKNVVEEKAFIPSDESPVMIEKEFGGLAYYSDDTNVLYVMLGGTLSKLDLETGEKTVLLEALEQDQYVSSDDGHLIAYQNQENFGEAVVLDFSSGAQQTVQVADGEVIRPLGFVMGDFVYGVARAQDAGQTAAGKSVLGMYKLEIRDSKNEVVKTYQVDGSYVLGVKMESNMITLNRATKNGSVYSEIAEDYITNNEEKTSSISLKSYWTDLKETQFRLVFDSGIDNKKAKVLKPKQVLFEQIATLEVEDSTEKAWYSAYGLGESVGVYEEAGEAVQAAKTVSGVVISPDQNYVWEDGNRVSWYRNFEMSAFVANAGESTLAASIRAVLAYEGASVDASSELQTKTVLEVLDANCGGEAVRFQGCSAADMRYLIDKGTPVIAMTGGSGAIVLIGYDAKTVTYIDPSSGGIRSGSIEAVDAMTSGSGNTFLGYVK